MTDTFSGVAADLWGKTAEDALRRAIEAQSQPVWRTLWAQCLRATLDSERSSTEPTSGTPALTPEAGPKADAAVIVAGFVLSVPSVNVRVLHGDGAEGTPLRSSVDEATLPEEKRAFLCVSLGSGSRCLGVRELHADSSAELLQRAFELRDGHAEVMARRGLLAFLMDLVEAAAPDSASLPFVERATSATAVLPSTSADPNRWALREGVRIHLVCSRWMCGSLAAVAGGAMRSGGLLLRAGCGCWASASLREAAAGKVDGATSGSAVVQHHVIAAHHSVLDDDVEYRRCARVKPGRGRPNLTMSCTDKVWRWATLGVQGRRRARLFPSPLRIASVHVLHAPAASVPSEMTDDEAAAMARDLFHWRTQAWWPEATTAELLAVTPHFFLFGAGASLTNGGGDAFSEPANPSRLVGAETGDSSYSRCRWLTVHRVADADRAASRKRDRGDAVATPCAAVRCDWRSADTSGGLNGLVLNTKAGLPQGMSARGLAQRALRIAGGVRHEAQGTRGVIAQAEEVMWRQCPLSRPWMARRLERVLATASATPSTETPSAAAEGQVAQPAPSPSRSWVTSLPCVPMHQLAHERHEEARNRGDTAVFLWSTTKGGEGQPL